MMIVKKGEWRVVEKEENEKQMFIMEHIGVSLFSDQ